jgi:hypothetical protein
MVLISDAPSESNFFVVLTQGNVFNSFPDNDAKNVSTESHPQIGRISPVPIRVFGGCWFYMSGGQWKKLNI